VAESGSNRKVANSLVALSSAAVLAVYAAGYERTRAAASRFTVQAEERRPPAPAAPVAAKASIDQPSALPLPQPERVEASRRPPEDAKPARKVARPGPAPRVESKQSPAAEMAPPVAPPPPAPAAVEPSPAVIAAPPEPEPVKPATPPRPVYKDGTYLGWGTSRHGDIQAQVVIEDGRIKAATIAQCLTRYSCNVISNLPPQVAQRQSPETDYVSGATQSTNAFYFAVVEALSKAK
jgi:uncharacterized protein with FMN-binding domain